MVRRLPFLRALRNLEIEEKILNIGATIAIVGVFFPWFGGMWFGEPRMWSGFGFYTSFVGILIFLANVFVVSLTVFPLLGYPFMKASVRDVIRFVVGAETIVLVLVVLTIYTKISFDFSQVGVRFGVYITLAGSFVVAIWSLLRMHQHHKRNIEQLFHHPEDDHSFVLPREGLKIKTEKAPLPPPPPSPEPEKARLF